MILIYTYPFIRCIKDERSEISGLEEKTTSVVRKKILRLKINVLKRCYKNINKYMKHK